MFALTFFGILHVPINVPALGLTTGEDNVDVDRELRAHGLSNALSGLCGSIQVWQHCDVCFEDFTNSDRIILSTQIPCFSCVVEATAESQASSWPVVLSAYSSSDLSSSDIYPLWLWEHSSSSLALI